MTEILKTPKGREIVLADGETYTLSPFSLSTLADLEEAFECDMEDLETKLMGRTASGLRKFLWVMLKKNYPDMSLAQAGDLVELEQVTTIIEEFSAMFESLKVE